MKIKRIPVIAVFSIVLFYAVGAAYIGWTDYKAQQNFVIFPEGTSLEEARKYYDDSIVLMAPATDETAYPADPLAGEPEVISIWEHETSVIIYVMFNTAFILTFSSLDYSMIGLTVHQAYSWTCCRLIDKKKSEKCARMYRYIRENPGCPSAEITKTLKISRSSFRYHCRELFEYGVKEVRFEGKLYYFCDGFPGDRQEYLKTLHLKKEARKEIYAKICGMPGISRQELAEELNIQKATVQYHAGRLMTDRLIDVIADGKNVRYYPSESGCS